VLNPFLIESINGFSQLNITFDKSLLALFQLIGMQPISEIIFTVLGFDNLAVSSKIEKRCTPEYVFFPMSGLSLLLNAYFKYTEMIWQYLHPL
jgi:hypothetical protein